MRIDMSGTGGTSRMPDRRVRHDVADGVALMTFSLASSTVIALLVSLVLGAS